jgi:hypothetical protein
LQAGGIKLSDDFHHANLAGGITIKAKPYFAIKFPQ